VRNPNTPELRLEDPMALTDDETAEQAAFIQSLKAAIAKKTERESVTEAHVAPFLGVNRSDVNKIESGDRRLLFVEATHAAREVGLPITAGKCHLMPGTPDTITTTRQAGRAVVKEAHGFLRMYDEATCPDGRGGSEITEDEEEELDREARRLRAALDIWLNRSRRTRGAA
jgi:hypothetical protein